MQNKEVKSCATLVASLLLMAALSGCAGNRASIMTRQQTGTPIKANEVKIFTSFKDINEPWQLEGMISVYGRSSVESREELIKETISGLGINTVVGVQKHPARSVGILANIGTVKPGTAKVMPKYIACLPAVNIKIKTTETAGNIDTVLREWIQASMSNLKGYYVYLSNDRVADILNIAQGGTSPEALSEPIGIAPDYAILVDLEGLSEEGKLMVDYPKALKLTMVLHDLKDRKPVGGGSAIGRVVQQRRIPIYAGSPAAYQLLQAQYAMEDQMNPIWLVYPAIRKALDDILLSMPAVEGFRIVK